MTRTLPSSRPSRAPRRGYTLMEILIVVGLIVLLIAVAVPVLNVLSGNRSTEAAENQVAAVLNQARAQAIALQKNIGVIFFEDPATGRSTLAYVGQEPGQQWIERLPDYDFVLLQPGTAIQLVNDDQSVAANVAASNRDRYVRSGVIMFDGRGQAVGTLYSILANSALAEAMDLPGMLDKMGINAKSAYYPDPAVYSQLGLVIYDNETFASQNFDPREGMRTPGEREENDWLDSNAVPFVVNRYNGTLIRGE